MLTLSIIILIFEIAFFMIRSFGAINQCVVGFAFVARIICTIVSAVMLKKDINSIKR